MKIMSKHIRIAFWILLGSAIALTSLALNRPFQTLQTPTPTVITDTIEAGVDVQKAFGSTDGIMFMAVIIVLIIISPILLRWRAWANGKR